MATGNEGGVDVWPAVAKATKITKNKKNTFHIFVADDGGLINASKIYFFIYVQF